MKRILLTACFAALALGQQSSSTRRPGEFILSANVQEHNGSLLHLAGNVTFETDAFVLRADNVDYDRTSRELRASGDVRVKLK